MQRAGQAIVGPLQHLFEHLDPKPGQYSEADISPYFWHNGQYPDSDEYKALFDGNFADYRLRINGLVDNPVELDLVQLRALPHHEQITQHFCIQGWSGIAKWGGVSMQTIVDIVKPQPEAKWVVFYSLGEGADKGVYYDAHPIEHMSHHLTMLAYDMNDEPLLVRSWRAAAAPQRDRARLQTGQMDQGHRVRRPLLRDSEAATAATTKTTNSSATDNPSRAPQAGKERDEALASADARAVIRQAHRPRARPRRAPRPIGRRTKTSRALLLTRVPPRRARPARRRARYPTTTYANAQSCR